MDILWKILGTVLLIEAAVVIVISLHSLFEGVKLKEAFEGFIVFNGVVLFFVGIASAIAGFIYLLFYIWS